VVVREEREKERRRKKFEEIPRESTRKTQNKT